MENSPYSHKGTIFIAIICYRLSMIRGLADNTNGKNYGFEIVRNVLLIGNDIEEWARQDQLERERNQIWGDEGKVLR